MRAVIYARYPKWWQGATFAKPVIMWVAGVTGESTRDNPQRILVGPPQQEEAWGTGWIPGDAIVDCGGSYGTVIP